MTRNQRGDDDRIRAPRLVTAGATDIGRVRSLNQDALGEFEDPGRGLQLLVVADGMGGHRGGEVASRIAVEAIGRVFREDQSAPGEILREAFETANREIYAAAGEDPELAGMGTTGVAILFGSPLAHDEVTGWVAHVGDSRAYRLRGGELAPLTADHSLVGEFVRRGHLSLEEARVHPQSNEILRALGTQSRVEVEIHPLEIEPGDRYLLCSDGLSGSMPESELAPLVAGDTPAESVRRLIAAANAAGGADNITVQIADIVSPAPEPRG